MSPRATQLVRAAILLLEAASSSACGPKPAQTTPTEPEPHHRGLHLPPVGPDVHVTLDGKATDVVLSSIRHEGASATLVQLWKVAFPSEDPAALHFDLVGSDGFHPGARPKCARLLTGAEIAAAHVDVVTHDVSFDPGVDLPGCYRVKAVVRVDAAR